MATQSSINRQLLYSKHVSTVFRTIGILCKVINITEKQRM